MHRQALDDAATAIQTYFDALFEELPDQPVTKAMRYALEGGKAMRGTLVLEGARLHGVDRRQALPAAAAIEAIHAYSLIHDDLPAMDDDDLRRGRPTVHRAWDEATAILAGDALQALGFELALRTGPPDVAVALTSALASAAGARGMVLGQALDIAAETAGSPLSLEEIIYLQQGKTGALIIWSATAGPILAGADPDPLCKYGAAIGLAFQIADDILDVEGCADTAGKRLQKDAAAGKATFVSLLGLEGAKARAEALVDEALAALAPYDDKADPLRALARFVIARKS